MTSAAPQVSPQPADGCMLCGGQTTPLFVVRGHTIVGCRSCGHQAAELPTADGHLERVYDDGYFTAGGAGYPDYLADADLLRAHGARYAQLLRHHTVPGTMLDVGAAAGFLTEAFAADGWRTSAVEPNRGMAAHMRARLGIDVHVGGLEDFRTDRTFDLIAMIQVVPHFIDPRRALAAAAALTAPHGWWLIETWNRDDIAARLLGRRWHEYNPPSVLHWFNPAGLRDLAASLGFAEMGRGRPRKRLSGAHLKAVLRHQLGRDQRGFDWIPDRLALPYPFTDVFWALFRRN